MWEYWLGMQTWPQGSEIFKHGKGAGQRRGKHAVVRISPNGCRNVIQVDKKNQLLSKHEGYDFQDLGDGENNFMYTSVRGRLVQNTKDGWSAELTTTNDGTGRVSTPRMGGLPLSPPANGGQPAQ